jgi:hypothetical protein
VTDKKEFVINPNRRASEEDNAEGRVVSVRRFLWTMLDALKKSTDPVTWLTSGGLDVEEFLECLETGRPHPVLYAWQEHKSDAAAHRPAPTSREKAARRLAVLACKALEQQTGMKNRQARQVVAKHIKDAKVFPSEPKPETLRNWERELGPALTQDDQKVVEAAQKSAGTDCKKLVSYFVGFMHLARKSAPLMGIRPL